MTTTTTKTGGLTSRGKFVLAALVVLILGGIYFAFQDKINSWAGSQKSGEVIRIGVNTWPGFAAGQYMNNGFDANMECRLYKEYGIQVQFVLLDDFLASRKAFESGEVDLLWCTADAFSTEMGQGGTMALTNPKILFQVDWSRGGDAIVVDASIESIADLKGKSVAVAEGTPSHSFLIYLLKANNMTIEDIELKPVPNAIDGANMFKQGQVDAAVVWSPDDVDCVKKVPGAKVLASTDEATHIIADCLFAKEEYIKNNQEKLQKLYDAWMVGAAELNADKNGCRKVAAKILADKFQMSESDALATMDNVRYTTHGDNKNFFGLGDGKAVTGDLLYTSMSAEFIKLGYVEDPLPWKQISDICLVKSSTLTGNGHLPEANKKFTAATEEQKDKKAYSTKKITINFPTNSSTLTNEAKAIINKQFADIARTNAGARIRIEGNTDNTGSAERNKVLSLERAQAVADYLVKEFGFDKNRFIVKGNGSKHAIDAGSYGADEQYRSTEFQLIKE